MTTNPFPSHVLILEVMRRHVSETEVELTEFLPLEKTGITTKSITAENAFYDDIQSSLGVEIPAQIRNKFNTVGDIVSYVTSSRASWKNSIEDKEFLGPATELLNHYSTVRITVVPAFLTVALGVAAYLAEYQSRHSVTGIRGWIVAGVLVAWQLLFLYGAFLTNQRCSNLHQITRKFLQELETDNIQTKARLFSRLEGTAVNRLKPNDWWDWITIALAAIIAMSTLALTIWL